MMILTRDDAMYGWKRGALFEAPRNVVAGYKKLFAAVMRVYFYSAAAAPEDYEACGMSVDIASMAPAAEMEFQDDLDWTSKNWPVGAHPGGHIVLLSLATVNYAIAGSWLPLQKQLLTANLGHQQWPVAAACLWATSLGANLQAAVSASVFCEIPLCQWHVVLKKVTNAVRRTGTVWDAAHVDTIKAGDAFRKLHNITGRNKQQADWDAEQLRRTQDLPIHMGGSFTWQSQVAWDRAFWRHALRRAKAAVDSVAHNVDKLQTAQEWWNVRHVTMASGSTSERKAAGLGDVTMWDKAARPNKKIVSENLSGEQLMRWVKKYRRWKRARRSTKPEPGFKARALFATDDASFAVAAYASAELERHLNFDGARVMQTPQDIVDWITMHRTLQGKGFWLSLDYTDFNSEHRLEDMVTLDMAFAQAWRDKNGLPAEVAADKVAACESVALSHRLAVVTGGEQPYRVLGGLFSGDRNTARDNTVLHAIYSDLALEFCGMQPSAVHGRNFTGDDEDTCFRNAEDALLYFMAHAAMGFRLKSEKQLCGDGHEFLQRTIAGDEGPTRPLCAALAQCASGNWYVQVRDWYDTIPGAVSETAWELHLRGLPLAVCRRLAAKVTSLHMRVRDGEASHKLEWWHLRASGGLGSQALWNTDEPAPSAWVQQADLAKPPVLEAGVATMATDAWIADKKSMIPGLSVNWPAYRKSQLEAVYAPLYKGHQHDQLKRYAINAWPARTMAWQAPEERSAAVLESKDLTSLYYGAAPTRVIRDVSTLLARLRLDADLVAAAGGLQKVLAALPPHMLAKWEHPQALLALPRYCAWLDPMERAWLATRGWAAFPALGGRTKRALPGFNATEKGTLLVIVAPNGAGKSTLCSGHLGVVDFDKLSRSVGLMEQQRRVGVEALTPAQAQLLAAELERLNAACLVTQQYGDSLHAALQLRNDTVVRLAAPASAVLRQRLMQRGWDSARVERRLERWALLSQQLKKTHKITTTYESVGLAYNGS